MKANILEETEKIEHNLSDETLEYIFLFVEFLETSPQYLEAYRNFLRLRIKNN